MLVDGWCDRTCRASRTILSTSTADSIAPLQITTAKWVSNDIALHECECEHRIKFVCNLTSKIKLQGVYVCMLQVDIFFSWNVCVFRQGEMFDVTILYIRRVLVNIVIKSDVHCLSKADITCFHTPVLTSWILGFFSDGIRAYQTGSIGSTCMHELNE